MKLKERIQYWGITGAVIGAICGFLFGYNFVYLPGIGTPLISGLFIRWMFLGFAGALIGGGLFALGVGICNRNVPIDSLLRCETFLNVNKL